MMAEMLEMGVDPMAELRALGYEFRDGHLRQANSNGDFVFQDGSHYESLAEAVAQYVPLLLEEEAQLCPLWLPLGSASGEGCPIFVSQGYEKAERLLLIIQGMGRVRAGVWGCSLCINNSLEEGTMLPYLRRAAASGYGVVVFNPNENTNDDVPIPGSENFNNHVAYVMEKVVLPRCAASQIDILAHSHGGRALLSYLARAGGSSLALLKKMRRLVFTDSYHVQTQLAYLPSAVKAFLANPARTVNFVPDRAPLGTPVQEWSSQENAFSQVEKGCLCLSAGVQDHPSTNHAAMSAVFDFFEAGSPEATPGPYNLQISRVESFHGLKDVNFALPEFDNYENNEVEVKLSSGNNRIEDALSDKGEAIVSNNCKVKKDGQWTRFKHLLRSTVPIKAITLTRSESCRVKSFKTTSRESIASTVVTL